MLSAATTLALLWLAGANGAGQQLAGSMWVSPLPSQLTFGEVERLAHSGGFRLNCSERKEGHESPLNAADEWCSINEPMRSSGPLRTTIAFRRTDAGAIVTGIYFVAFPTQRTEERGTKEHFDDLARLASILLGERRCAATQCHWLSERWKGELQSESIGSRATLLITRP
jgi:hypothetical protein